MFNHTSVPYDDYKIGVESLIKKMNDIIKQEKSLTLPSGKIVKIKGLIFPLKQMDYIYDPQVIVNIPIEMLYLGHERKQHRVVSIILETIRLSELLQESPTFVSDHSHP